MVKNLPPKPSAGSQGKSDITEIDHALGQLEISSSGTATPPSSSNGDEDGGATLTTTNPTTAQKPLSKGAQQRANKATKKAAAAEETAAKKAAAEKTAKAASEEDAKENDEKKAARHARIIKYFDETYGRKEDRLEAWQLLCEHLGVAPGQSIKKCKQALKKVNVNIFDFVASKQGGPAYQKFPTASALRNYTVKNSKFFPLKKAKASPTLRCMLITIFFK